MNVAMADLYRKCAVKSIKIADWKSVLACMGRIWGPQMKIGGVGSSNLEARCKQQSTPLCR